jgi:hypothetical protein
VLRRMDGAVRGAHVARAVQELLRARPQQLRGRARRNGQLKAAVMRQRRRGKRALEFGRGGATAARGPARLQDNPRGGAAAPALLRGSVGPCAHARQRLVQRDPPHLVHRRASAVSSNIPVAVTRAWAVLLRVSIRMLMMMVIIAFFIMIRVMIIINGSVIVMAFSVFFFGGLDLARTRHRGAPVLLLLATTATRAGCEQR